MPEIQSLWNSQKAVFKTIGKKKILQWSSVTYEDEDYPELYRKATKKHQIGSNLLLYHQLLS